MTGIRVSASVLPLAVGEFPGTELESESLVAVAAAASFKFALVWFDTASVTVAPGTRTVFGRGRPAGCLGR